MFFFLLPIIFTHHLIGMLQPKNPPNPFYAVPEIRDDVIYNLFPYAFNKNDSPKIIRSTLHSMCCVNKKLNLLIRQQDITHTIIDKIGYNQDYWALAIKTPTTRNYLNKSVHLYKYITQMKANTITSLLKTGADINYCPVKKRPLLFKSLKSYNSTRLLLDHGVNLNVIFHSKTALQRMIEKDNFIMSKLLLSYNPHNKCLPIAIFYKNPAIIHLILQCNNIPLSELNESLAIALVQKQNKQIINALINAGAQLQTVSADINKTIDRYKTT